MIVEMCKIFCKLKYVDMDVGVSIVHGGRLGSWVKCM